MPTHARRIALGILRQVDAGGVLLADLLAADEPASLDPRERGFLHELVLGALRHRGAIDHALASIVDRPLEDVDRGALAILRLGAYQILRMRVPPRAAVHESVELSHQQAPRAASFVNAVLRRLSREAPATPPDVVSDPARWLTEEGSLPRWLADRWLKRLGPARAAARARAFLEPPLPVFRLNPRVADAWDRAAPLVPKPCTVPGAYEATAGRPTELANAGVVYMQEEGSQLVAHLAATQGLVLDACAAPGGKATLLGDLLGERGRVVAAEASGSRLATLASLVRRWGSTNVECLAADVLRPPFRGGFESVLLDAPCTGLGTLSRHPDIRWRLKESEIGRQARRQALLIASAASLVAKGGLLVYATCSSEPEENEDVVTEFLAVRREFEPDPVPAWASTFRDGRFVRTLPEAGHGEAFFAAALRRSA